MSRISSMYKTRNFIYKDAKEKKYTDVFNEYGYNFETFNKNITDTDSLVIKPRLMTNKDYINKR